LEIQGPSGSGKTSLVVFLMMISILPESYETEGKHGGETGGKIKVEIGGKGQRGALLYMENDRAPIEKLRRGMKAHLERCFRNAGMGSVDTRHEAIDSVIQGSLARLVVFKIPSSADGLDLSTTVSPWAGICTGLKSLSFNAKKRAGGEISLVVVEGLGDPYWQSRWYKDQQIKLTRGASKPAKNEIIGSSELGMEDIMDILTTLRKDLGCVVVVTNQSLWRPNHTQTGKTDTSSSFWAQHLPSPWPDPFQIRLEQTTDSANPVLRSKINRHWPLNVHITLSSPATSIRQFRPDITLEETWSQNGEGYKREMARREAVWKGLIRCNTGRGRPVDHGEFEMRIGRDGLIVD
jgi:hypothetical protein